MRQLESTAAANLNMSDLQARKIERVAQFGEISLNFEKMELSRAGQPVDITAREFKVMKFLISRPEIVVSRQKLISSAFPKRKRATYRTVDNCIARLRQKIESDPGQPVFIRTVHGVGYKFVPREGAYSSGRVLVRVAEER